MQRPSADIEGCRLAHARLIAVASAVTEPTVNKPSLLAGWTVGHVLTHLARNAESAFRRLGGAVRGEVVDQYVGGAAGRAAEIETGASRTAKEIVDDTLLWANRVDELFATVSDAVWSRQLLTVSGERHPAVELPFRRWREVEVHMVDLGLDTTVADWPEEFVDRALPNLLSRLPHRADSRALVAWLTGRGPSPDLEPWG